MSSLEKVSDRRHKNNTYFLSLNSAFVGAIAYLGKLDRGTSELLFVLLASFAGVMICFVWFLLIMSYKNLNSGKFKVLRDIESLLPIAPFRHEWNLLENGKNHKKYLPFTKIEVMVPGIFLFVYVAIFLFTVLPFNCIGVIR